MPSPSTNPPRRPKPPADPAAPPAPKSNPNQLLSAAPAWFAPHSPRHRSRRLHRSRRKLQKLTRFIMPTIVILLAVLTAGVAFKWYVIDRRTKPIATQSAANAAQNFAILEAEMSGYESAFAQGRASSGINLYGDGLILDSSLAVSTYSNRLRPEVRAAMQRTNFDLNAHMTQPATSTNLADDVMLDPRLLLRSRTNRPKVVVDTSSEIVRIAVEGDRQKSTAGAPTAHYQAKSTERPSVSSGETKRTPTVPRSTPSSSPASKGAERPAPPEPQLLLAKAGRLYASGDFAGAEALCVQLRKEAPGLKGLHNMLGEIYSRQRRWEDSIKEFEAAIKEEETNAEYHNNLGLVLSQLNKDDLAEVHLAKAQKLDPMNATIMLNYAWHCRKLKRYQDAIKYFDLALVIDPNNVQAKNKRIQTLLDLQRYSEVEEIVQNQLVANPRDAQAHLMMAVLRTRQGDAKTAVEWLQKVEPITSRPTLLAMLEKINDFEPIKNTPEYQAYLASLKATP